MSFKGYKPTYLKYGWSGGSGGNWYFLHLSDDDRVLKTPCMGQ